MSQQVRHSLVLIQEHLRHKGVSIAYTHPADAHITLVFLGDTDPELIDRLKPLLDEVAAGFAPFRLMLGGGGFFGPPRAPKVAWIGIGESASLMRLQAVLAVLVESAGVALERRPFHPHLTLARIRDPIPPAALTLIRSSITNTAFEEVPVDRVLFMSSQPNGSGSRYKILHESPLKGIQDHG